MTTKQSPPVGTRVLYGIGSVAYGVKDNGFAYFLLIFYSQAVGLDAEVVGTALALALVVDAITDPMVGELSDITRSRLGRRHPYMYAAIIPIAVMYYGVWNPPADLGVADSGFAYVFTSVVAVRVLVTFFEVPSTAMVAELTPNYHTRTKLLSFRYMFGWMGGLTMSLLAYTVFLQPTEVYPDGIFNLKGWGTYGLVASFVMAIAIFASALGTQRAALSFHVPPARRFEPKRIAREMFASLSTPAFRVLFVSSLPGAIAAGTVAGLAIYVNTYFWGFDTDQIGALTATGFASAVLAFFFAPWMSARYGKRSAAISVSLAAIFFAVLPMILRLFGAFPENGTSTLFCTMMGFTAFDTMLVIAAGILVSSMVADVVEESQIATGRRSEALFYAVRQFVGKALAGIGVLMASMILALIEFPVGVAPGEVDPGTLDELVYWYVPIVGGLYVVSILILRNYPISESVHEQNLARLHGVAAEPETP